MGWKEVRVEVESGLGSRRVYYGRVRGEGGRRVGLCLDFCNVFRLRFMDCYRERLIGLKKMIFIFCFLVWFL